MDLVEALGADAGVVSVVGAGGKKSTMYRLAERLERPLLTSTVRIPIFDPHVARVVVTEEPVDAVEHADDDDWPLGVVPEREGDDRYRGYDPTVIDDLADLSSVQTVLVKADGARMRKFKAPGAREPRIPTSTTVVVPVVSAHVIDEPLDEGIVHRVERVARLTGRGRGDDLTPDAIATVIAHPEGGHKDVPAGATVVPLVNMVDDEHLERRARSLAFSILERCDASRVVLTQLTAERPVIDIVDRS